jgi:ubiquinone biosynthesis protein COQ4
MQTASSSNNSGANDVIEDVFEQEFIQRKIGISNFQRTLLALGSSIAAILDPRRQDMIACLGETTGVEALNNVLQKMKSSDEGQMILKDKPRINSSTVNLTELASLPQNTFGYHYSKFLTDNVS